MATFVTSAFWHGFESGYYMTFVLAAFIQTVAKNCRRLIRPFFLNPATNKPTPRKPIYDIASYLATQLAFSFTVTPFILLKTHTCLTAWARVYFYCIVGVAAALALFSSPGKAYLKQQLAARAKRLGVAAPPTPSPSQVDSPAPPPPPPRPLSRVDSGIPATRQRFQDVEAPEQARMRGPVAGLPDDPGEELDEILEELKAEMAARRQRGQSIGTGLQEAVQNVGEELRKRRGEAEGAMQEAVRSRGQDGSKKRR